MEQEAIRKLIVSLGYFGIAKYRHHDFLDLDKPNWACIELITDKKTAQGLEGEINPQLTLEAGFRAWLVFTQLEEMADRKYRYAIDIIPRDYVPKLQWENAVSHQCFS